MQKGHNVDDCKLLQKASFVMETDDDIKVNESPVDPPAGLTS